MKYLGNIQDKTEVEDENVIEKDSFKSFNKNLDLDKQQRNSTINNIDEDSELAQRFYIGRIITTYWADLRSST